jgi:hypothetical protein
VGEEMIAHDFAWFILATCAIGLIIAGRAK